MEQNQFADDLIAECARRHDECQAAGNTEAAQWWKSFAAFVHLRAYPEDAEGETDFPGGDVRDLVRPVKWKWFI